MSASSFIQMSSFHCPRRKTRCLKFEEVLSNWLNVRTVGNWNQRQSSRNLSVSAPPHAPSGSLGMQSGWPSFCQNKNQVFPFLTCMKIFNSPKMKFFFYFTTISVVNYWTIVLLSMLYAKFSFLSFFFSLKSNLFIYLQKMSEHIKKMFKRNFDRHPSSLTHPLLKMNGILKKKAKSYNFNKVE